MNKALVLATTGLLLALALAACTGGDDDDEAARLPEFTPFPSPLAERLHGIRDAVAEIRELPVNAAVTEGLISRETLQQYSADELRGLTEEDQADIAAWEVALKMLGLLPADYDYGSIVEGSVGQIAGFYEFREDRLALVASEVGEELSLSDELTLAHEYVHTLQDAKWDIVKLQEKWFETDLEEDGFAQYTETLDCLIEGDATFATQLYAEDRLGPDWRQQVLDEAALAGAQEEEEGLPEFLQRALAFNYADCPVFVEELYNEGGWDAVNAAYERPPATTEQVIHVDKYRSRELANVDAPPDLGEHLDGWREVGSAQFGEYDVYNYALTRTQDPALAVGAAFGWGAGWSRVYRNSENEDDVVFQLYLSFDTDLDLLEFLAVFTSILSSYGVDPESLQPGEIVRWSSSEEFGQQGAVLLNDRFAEIELRMATNEESLLLAVPELAE